MNNPLAKNFSLKDLLKYTFPSIIASVFMSTYMVIDGIFVSTFVGEDALAAVNLITPLFGIVMAAGLMLAAGSNAIIAKFLGQKKDTEARQFLTVIYVLGAIIGLILTTFVFLFSEQLINILSVPPELYQLSKDYLLSIGIFLVPVLFMMFSQSFMITAGNPNFGLILSLCGGLTNIILDYILISPHLLNLGIAGAGYATGLGFVVTGMISFAYFLFNKKGTLYFVKPKFNFKLIVQSLYNGSSELVSSLATSLTGLMFNFILLRMVGSSGVAAISTILYIQMFQTAIYNGFIIGVSPIISFKYGEENHKGLHKVIMQSFKIICTTSLIVISLTLLFSSKAIEIFISKDSATFDMARNGLLLFLPAYLFMGFNLFLSAMFTALSNGKISALISVLRTLVFIVITLLTLPQWLGINGVWLSIPVAELMAIFVATYFYRINKHTYHY